MEEPSVKTSLQAGVGTRGVDKGGLTFPILGATKSAVSTNSQSRFASPAHGGVLGPPTLTVSLYLCSFETMYASRLRALEGRVVSVQKALQGSEIETRELLEQQKRILIP